MLHKGLCDEELVGRGRIDLGSMARKGSVSLGSRLGRTVLVVEELLYSDRPETTRLVNHTSFSTLCVHHTPSLDALPIPISSYIYFLHDSKPEITIDFSSPLTTSAYEDSRDVLFFDISFRDRLYDGPDCARYRRLNCWIS